MVKYEQDTDDHQWGLHLFDTDSVYSSGYYGGNVIQHDANSIYDEQFFKDHYNTECSLVQNDESIALALQEEFARLDMAEGSGYAHPGDHAQTSFYSQEWPNSSTGNCYSGEFEQADDTRTSSQCSSPGDAGGHSYSLELTDEYVYDDAGKRPNQMIPIPHVPRINGEIPSIDEATSDYQRLLDRIQLYDLVEHKVKGDGNCQFRALSDQLFQSPDHHKVVRQQIVNQLKSHPEIYEGYVPMAYDDYLGKMSKSGEWGDHVTLQAAADSYGVKIFVITSFKDTCYIEILPDDWKSKRVIFLSFWAEVHYNSIYPPGDIPSGESRKKKWWWIFGNKQ